MKEAQKEANAVLYNLYNINFQQHGKFIIGLCLRQNIQKEAE